MSTDKSRILRKPILLPTKTLACIWAKLSHVGKPNVLVVLDICQAITYFLLACGMWTYTTGGVHIAEHCLASEINIRAGKP